MKRPLVITGCPHSGTAYAAWLFNLTHESDYNLDDHGPAVYTGDSSYMAAPYVADEPFVAHLVRDPRYVVRGLVMQNPQGRHRDFMQAHTVPWGDDLERSLFCFWVRWNQMVEPHATFRIRLEDIAALGQPINSKVPPEYPVPELPSGGLGEEVRLMARGYGYDL